MSERRWMGVISDTHGLLRPSVLEALAGCEQIAHAGDVGDPAIIDRLSQLAPVTVIRGNVDREAWAQAWPETEVIEAFGRRLYMLHDLDTLDLDLRVAGMDGVIFGHTHRPHFEMIDGLLHLNPGSAGPRRFDLPISLARLWFEDGVWGSERVDLPE